MALTASKRIRRDYAPLNVALGVTNSTPNSPLIQVYDPDTGTYNPDRTITWLVIKPVLKANAPDGTLVSELGNADMAVPTWYVNGVALAESALAGDCTVHTAQDSDRGTLEVRYNVKPGTQIELHMESYLNDPRTGRNIFVRSEPIILSTVEKSDDSYQISLEDAACQPYNPINDTRLLVQWMDSHGYIKKVSDAMRIKAKSGVTNYLRNIKFGVWRGKVPATDKEMVLRCYAMASGGLGTLLASTDGGIVADEIVEFDKQHIAIDLRMVEDAINYAIVALVKRYGASEEATWKIVAVQQLGIKRQYPKLTLALKNECDVAATDRYHSNETMISCKGKVLDYPGACLSTVWKTDSYGATGMTHSESSKARIRLSDCKMGDTESTAWLDVRAEVDYKTKYYIATDDEGNTLTDEIGNELIFN